MPTIKNVINDCGAYIDFLRTISKNCFLTRGIFDKGIDIIKKPLSVAKREPKNVGQNLHNILNSHYTEIFGWPVRNGLFCYGITMNLEKEIKDLGYGKTHLLFPCGKFRYVYDPKIFDLAAHHYKFNKEHNDGKDFQNFIKTINYLDSGLSDYISKEQFELRSVEIILNCEFYYLLDVKYSKELTKIIWD